MSAACFCLSISPLKIEIVSQALRSSTELVEEGVEESLRRYYLDWSNMDNTTEADVDSLLNGFWQYYLAEDKQLDAYRALDLEVGVAWPEVQSRYRSLVAKHHPDRGGNASEFMAIREAYEILQNLNA